MNASLQISIARVDGGWRLHWGPFLIVTTRTEPAAKAVSALLDSLNNLPAITPASLVMLAGWMPGQVVGPKYKTLAELWGYKLMAQWTALRTTNVETTMFSAPELESHLVGQTIPPILLEG